MNRGNERDVVPVELPWIRLAGTASLNAKARASPRFVEQYNGMHVGKPVGTTSRLM